MRALKLMAQGSRAQRAAGLRRLYDAASDAAGRALVGTGSHSDADRDAAVGRAVVDAVLDALGPERSVPRARVAAPAPNADRVVDAVTIELRVEDWHRIDGSLDNSANVDRIAGGLDGAAIDDRCLRIREVGWQASRQHAEAGRGAVGWPPSGATLAIALTRDDWRFVLAQIERWGSWERDDDPAAAFERWLRQRIAER